MQARHAVYGTMCDHTLRLPRFLGDLVNFLTWCCRIAWDVSLRAGRIMCSVLEVRVDFSVLLPGGRFARMGIFEHDIARHERE